VVQQQVMIRMLGVLGFRFHNLSQAVKDDLLHRLQVKAQEVVDSGDLLTVLETINASGRGLWGQSKLSMGALGLLSLSVAWEVFLEVGVLSADPQPTV
jgi:hypothetical protein